MTKYGAPLALAALLGGSCAGPALAVGSGLSMTATAGDNLLGYHTYGTEQQPLGYSIDASSDTSNPIWSFGFSPVTTGNNNDFFLFSHSYNPGGTGTNATTGINNGYFLRMRGDNGQLAIGNDTSGALDHPGSTAQVKIWAGTSTQLRGGLAVSGHGNYNGLLLDQADAGTLRTKVNFGNLFQVGTDSFQNGTPAALEHLDKVWEALGKALYP